MPVFKKIFQTVLIKLLDTRLYRPTFPFNVNNKDEKL